MARLQMWVSSQLMQRLKAFAERQYGGSDRTALAKVVEAALHWWLEKGGKEEKPTTKWEFPEAPITKQNANGIRRWLFRR